MRTVSSNRPSGRPSDSGLTEAILVETLHRLAGQGYDGCRLDAIAAACRTSKQALYRRWPAKPDLVAAALARGFDRVDLPPPQRRSVAEDLSRFLRTIHHAFRETPLGPALAAALSHRNLPGLDRTITEADGRLRLALRQILIATPFERDMEIRIDLLLGLAVYWLQVQDRSRAEEDINRAVHLVLGLIAPRAPDPNAGLPGQPAAHDFLPGA